ncbi:hypothetical protein C2S52_011120 [Perilla frutescens var. hirtella]|uniref:Uncharacterized protein n=1 Tax=Perilla frutescens var. hirtella TaxID=608512 RepID=A0AAD4P7R8_PERFH|nr:hypothetical protein C2S52_011120 [Perilla frutescens var. hirtella]KAH6817917.1 hypothetical protein C2S51_001520 [Perilla frutescens var. frutescens]KAH6830018.1 hypothetical protein C2S53_000333 [Perilla frutescens var. hirtella]
MDVGEEEKREKKGLGEKGENENVRFFEAALKKCLEERKGQNSAMVTCKSIVEAIKERTSSSTSSSSSLKKNPLKPILRSGRFTDV